MIFVTVGAQMPFDRLIAAVDQWSEAEGRDDVLAQVGEGAYRPRAIRYERNINPPEFRRRMMGADLVVAHAGMGTILTALELGKPILVMPRRGNLSETRNDHQVATANHFSAHGQVSVAMDEMELAAKLRQVGDIRCAGQIGPYASPALLHTLRRFIATGQVGAEPAGMPSDVGAGVEPVLVS
jgi:UDP-N-acetylglucosamine transferase subunit ALG13